MWRWVLLLSTFVVAWLSMMIIHETGHIAAGFATGAKVERVVLHPLRFSRTDFSVNPSPRTVIWGGPVVGCILPLGAWLGAYIARFRYRYILQVVAGFCLIANGAYIGYGWIDHVGDAGDLLRLGVSRSKLIAFGAVTVSLGLWLWNGTGHAMGFGRDATQPRAGVAGGMFAVALLIVLAELSWARPD